MYFTAMKQECLARTRVTYHACSSSRKASELQKWGQLLKRTVYNYSLRLFQMVGHEALDEIITPLLEKLTPEKEDVLAGLCEIMKQNSR